ncbi:MAG: DUF5915 domain-containing protein, partial [Acutalibacteraceae bacterium]
QKMSKSKGNAVDPFEALATYGADAIRWYFYTNSAPWLPNRFHGGAVIEGQRKFMGTLWNTYGFFVLYANIDNFDATKYALEYDKLSVMDKWLLSKMNTMVKKVDENLDAYKIPESAKALQEFVDDMSNWYVRRCRERFWKKELDQDKINAYMTLYTALVTVSKAAAPMIPFMTEEIYQNLVRSIDKNAPESIHLCSFPKVVEAQIDAELEKNMDEVLTVVGLGRAARNTSNIKNRQPLGEMYVSGADELSSYYVEIIEDELNVKKVSFVTDADDLMTYLFKPQMKTLGPKFGKKLGAIRNALAAIENSVEVKKALDTDGVMKLDIGDEVIELSKDDVLIEAQQKEGLASVSDRGVTVALSTLLTQELIEEGFVREVISKVQTMRKDAGFEVTDHIALYIQTTDKLTDILGRNSESLTGDVLADKLVLDNVSGYTAQWNINGEKATIGVEKI